LYCSQGKLHELGERTNQSQTLEGHDPKRFGNLNGSRDGRDFQEINSCQQ
jgi:hypothetical protein